MIVPRAFARRLLFAAALTLCASPALSQSTDADDPVFGGTDVSQVGKIGRLHDRIRGAKQRESLYQEISGPYRDYADWKARVQKETDVTYSIDLSFLQQWGSSGGGRPALQLYAAPSLDWTVFKSTRWGTTTWSCTRRIGTAPTSSRTSA